MSKQSETAAFDKFITEIERIAETEGGGSYFIELLGTREWVAKNIHTDFPALCGIMVSQEEHDTQLAKHESEIAGLKAKHEAELQADDAKINELEKAVAELKKYDVRALNKRRQEIAEELDRIEALSVEVDKINAMLDGRNIH